MSKNKLIHQISLESEQVEGAGGQIAQEGVVDWFKDLFTTKLTLADVSKVRVTTDLMSQVDGDTNIPPFQKGANVNRVRFMMKNHAVSSNLPKDIIADANNLKLIADILHDINKSLAKISLDDEVNEVISSLKNIRQEAIMRLNRTKWLGNFHIEFRDEHPDGDISTAADGQISKPQLNTIGGGIVGIIIGVVIYFISDAAYERNLKAVNNVVSQIDPEEFAKATKVAEKQFAEILNALAETYKQVERLKKHDVKEVRHTLRFTRNLAATAIYISEVYTMFYRHVTG